MLIPSHILVYLTLAGHLIPQSFQLTLSHHSSQLTPQRQQQLTRSSRTQSKHPQQAWGNALTIVGCIGGTVITLTAIGTYFIAKAENKRLKKAKKSSNLLGGRYGAAKGDPDSDDEEKPVYEPMTMRDMV